MELFIQWDMSAAKDPWDKLEGAVCLHMHLANQRDHLDIMTCEARDVMAVAPIQYHTESQPTEEDIFIRGA